DKKLQQALADIGLKPGDQVGEAKLIAHAEAAGIQPEQVGNGAKIVNAIPEAKTAVKDGGLLKNLKGQAGFTATDLNFMLARSIAAGLYGYSQGDTTEDRIKNALIFAGLGAIASPSMIKRIITGAKKVDPEIIREHSRRDEGLSPTVD